jgi:hypothetical protein
MHPTIPQPSIGSGRLRWRLQAPKPTADAAQKASV